MGPTEEEIPEDCVHPAQKSLRPPSPPPPERPNLRRFWRSPDFKTQGGLRTLDINPMETPDPGGSDPQAHRDPTKKGYKDTQPPNSTDTQPPRYPKDPPDPTLREPHRKPLESPPLQAFLQAWPCPPSRWPP